MSIKPKSCEGGRFFTLWLPCQLDPKAVRGTGFLHRHYHVNWTQKLKGGKVFYIVITMSIGPKAARREGFLHRDYHVNGQNTVLRLMGFLHGDHHVNWTENWEQGRFFTWWLPCQWAKHGFEVFYMVITMSIGPMPTKITNWLAPKKKISRNPWFRSELRNHDNHGIMNPKTKISCWYDGKMPMVSVLAAKPKVVQHARPLRGSAD